MKPIQTPKIPLELARKGVIPAAFIAALTGTTAIDTLEQVEGNILKVYADKLASGIPTYCAGRTDWTAKVGTRLTSDFCKEVNKITMLEYGFAVLACANWNYLDADRLIGLTLFAINIGKDGACGSQAMVNINRGRVFEGCRMIAYKPSGAPNWSYSDGKFVPGLHNRRKVELGFCVKGLT